MNRLISSEARISLSLSNAEFASFRRHDRFHEPACAKSEILLRARVKMDVPLAP
jgi:hypothetical protein